MVGTILLWVIWFFGFYFSGLLRQVFASGSRGVRAEYDASYFEVVEAGYRPDSYKLWFQGVIWQTLTKRGSEFHTCLDVGCAYGYFMSGLRQRIATPEMIGVEISTYAAKRAKKLTGKEIIVASAEALPFRDKSFDLVTALEVVEHLVEAPQHLQETHRVLTRGGTYFASSPNRVGVGRLFELLGLLQSNPTHTKLYTPGQLGKQLRAAGFTRLHVRGVQMGLPLPQGRFLAISFPLPFGSSIFASGQK
jgi:ubiquinone/menaquinone biosynthesis C-methylase UbiE